MFLFVVLTLFVIMFHGEPRIASTIRRYCKSLSTTLGIPVPVVTILSKDNPELGWNLFRGMELGVSDKSSWKDIVHHEYAHSMNQENPRSHDKKFYEALEYLETLHHHEDGSSSGR